MGVAALSMAKPLVSVGISFKNPGDYLVLAIKSVLVQTFPDWELLLLDDGTSDGSEALPSKILDPRVRAFRDGHSRNLNVRLNEMVRLARGKYFFRMDADDVMHPRRIERQLQLLESASADTVVGSSAFSIDSQSKVVGFRTTKIGNHHGFGARHSFIHPTVAGRRDWFLKNPYSESFLYHRAQDAELWCRTSQSSRFEVTSEPLLFYRESDTFSFSNYLGTSMGILHLAQVHASNQLVGLKQVTTELGKTWLTTASYVAGHADWIVNRRFKAIKEQQRLEAQTILDSITNHSVPEARGRSAA